MSELNPSPLERESNTSGQPEQERSPLGIVLITMLMLVALIVWVYYSAQILFFGAEFTQVFATRYGSRIEPSRNAIRAHELPPVPKAREGRTQRLQQSEIEPPPGSATRH